MKPIPASLYKYRSLAGESRQRTLDALRENALWFASPSSFNDPFDCRLPVPTTLTPQVWKTFLPKILGNALEGVALENWDPATPPPEKLRDTIELIDKLVQRRKGLQGPRAPRPFDQILNEMATEMVTSAAAQVDYAVGVLTLSAVPDHILLWTNYADTHSGICIELDVETSGLPRLAPVIYEDTVPSYDEVIEAVALHQWNFERPGLLADIAYKAATADLSPSKVFYWTGRWLFAKSSEWTYENEWRSITAGSGSGQFPAGTFKSVIIGAMTPKEDVAAVRDAIKDQQPPVSLRRAQPRKDRFGLDIVPLD